MMFIAVIYWIYRSIKLSNTYSNIQITTIYMDKYADKQDFLKILLENTI